MYKIYMYIVEKYIMYLFALSKQVKRRTSLMYIMFTLQCQKVQNNRQMLFKRAETSLVTFVAL